MNERTNRGGEGRDSGYEESRQGEYGRPTDSGYRVEPPYGTNPERRERPWAQSNYEARPGQAQGGYRGGTYAPGGEWGGYGGYGPSESREPRWSGAGYGGGYGQSSYRQGENEPTDYGQPGYRQPSTYRYGQSGYGGYRQVTGSEYGQSQYGQPEYGRQSGGWGSTGSGAGPGSYRGPYGQASYGGEYGQTAYGGESTYREAGYGGAGPSPFYGGGQQSQAYCATCGTTTTPTREGRYTGRGPKGYRRSDERIKDDVCDRLAEHPDIDAGDITVNVSNGEVNLAGTVDDRRMKHMVENVVDAVSGVKEVNNQLRVSRSEGSTSRMGEAQSRGESASTGTGTRAKPTVAGARA